MIDLEHVLNTHRDNESLETPSCWSDIALCINSLVFQPATSFQICCLTLQMKGGAIAWCLLKFQNNSFTYINVVFLMWTHKTTGAKVWDHHSLLPSCIPALLYRPFLNLEFQVRVAAGDSDKAVYLVLSSLCAELNPPSF